MVLCGCMHALWWRVGECVLPEYCPTPHAQCRADLTNDSRIGVEDLRAPNSQTVRQYIRPLPSFLSVCLLCTGRPDRLSCVHGLLAQCCCSGTLVLCVSTKHRGGRVGESERRTVLGSAPMTFSYSSWLLYCKRNEFQCCIDYARPAVFH